MAKGKHMKMEEYPDREMLAMQLANVLASELRKCLLVHPFASFAVPGGTSPGPIFDMICATDLDWDRVHVMLTDERWVDEDDPQSNARLIRDRLLVDKASAATFMPFYRDGMDAPTGAATVAGDLASELPISLLMLGMGDDMHTASLFPGADGLAQALAPDAPLLCAVQPEGQVPRVTLPAHALQGAMSKHLLIYGDAKRKALERALHLPPQDAPIATVLDGLTVHWAA